MTATPGRGRYSRAVTFRGPSVSLKDSRRGPLMSFWRSLGTARFVTESTWSTRGPAICEDDEGDDDKPRRLRPPSWSSPFQLHTRTAFVQCRTHLEVVDSGDVLRRPAFGEFAQIPLRPRHRQRRPSSAFTSSAWLWPRRPSSLFDPCLCLPSTHSEEKACRLGLVGRRSDEGDSGVREAEPGARERGPPADARFRRCRRRRHTGSLPRPEQRRWVANDGPRAAELGGRAAETQFFTCWSSSSAAMLRRAVSATVRAATRQGVRAIHNAGRGGKYSGAGSLHSPGEGAMRTVTVLPGHGYARKSLRGARARRASTRPGWAWERRPRGCVTLGIWRRVVGAGDVSGGAARRR